MKHDKSTKSRVPDLPGQLGMTTGGEAEMYYAEPDAACAKNAKPLVPPERDTEPIDNIRKVIGKDGSVHWEDSKGNVVGYGDQHPLIDGTNNYDKVRRSKG